MTSDFRLRAEPVSVSRVERQTISSNRHHVSHLAGEYDLTPAAYKAKQRAIEATYKLACRRAQRYPYGSKDKPGRDPSSSLSVIWRCLYRAKRPLTRDELMRRLKIDRGEVWALWNFSSRLSQMVKEGNAELAGEKKGTHNRLSPLYRAVFAPDLAAIAEAGTARLIQRAALDKEWQASPFAGIDSEMLDRIPDRRSRRILRARIQGKSLVQVGRELGITHERVRQIQNRALELLGQ